MRKTLILSAILFSFFMEDSIFACTAFIAVDGDTVLVGGNEDPNKNYPIKLKFEPAEKEKYGRVYFIYKDEIPQTGINDQGLMFDYFATPFSSPKVTVDKQKTEFNGLLMNKALKKCATVKQVLKFIDKYNLGFLKHYKCQVFIADSTGASAIIEGDNILRGNGKYQIVTNFHQSSVPVNKKPCEWYRIGCDRYKTALTMLKDQQNISVDGFRKVLAATCVEGLLAETLYSYIYDFKQGLLYVYYLHNFKKAAVINLKDELKKEKHAYDLSSLIAFD
jgi:hypothetical protein